MSAYTTSRSLARAARRRPQPMAMQPQTTNPSRFWQWLTIALELRSSLLLLGRAQASLARPSLNRSLWLLVFASTAVLGAMALLALFFGIE